MEEKTATQQDTVTISGTVKEGGGMMLIVVTADQIEHKINVTKSTQVLKEGKPTTMTDVKVGSTVIVEAKKGTDATLTALTITIPTA